VLDGLLIQQFETTILGLKLEEVGDIPGEFRTRFTRL
jgi:hypothetical protein